MTIGLPGMLYSHGAPLSFVGFTSDTPFSTVTIADPTRGLAFDNFTYASGGASVPEPASAALVGLALVGLSIARKRRRLPV